MSDTVVSNELEWLRSRVAALEQLQEVHEKAVLDQSERLEQSLAELRERNRQLADSEQALRRQTGILQAVLDSMADGVAVADEHGKFLLFNPAAERILGFGPMNVTPEQWTEQYGCYLADGMTPCPVEKMPLVRAIRGEEVDDFEEYINNPKRPD